MERPPMKMAIRGSHCEVISGCSLGDFGCLMRRSGKTYLEVLKELADQALTFAAEAQDGEGDVTEEPEDTDDGEVEVEAGLPVSHLFPSWSNATSSLHLRRRIKMIQMRLRQSPPSDKVVENRQHPATPDSKVRPDIRHNCKLRAQRDIRDDKLPKQRRERSMLEPVFERPENEFRTAVSVLLPAGKLVVDGQGDAFFEEFAFGRGEAGEADEVAFVLEAEGHVEVFGDGGFGPVVLFSG